MIHFVVFLQGENGAGGEDGNGEKVKEMFFD